MIERTAKATTEPWARLAAVVAHGPLLAAGNISMTLETRDVTLAGVPLDLTHQEFELLRVLLQAPNCVLANPRICEAIWGSSGRKETRRLAVVVSHLRRKLEPGASYVIENVRCRGYGLVQASRA